MVGYIRFHGQSAYRFPLCAQNKEEEKLKIFVSLTLVRSVRINL